MKPISSSTFSLVLAMLAAAVGATTLSCASGPRLRHRHEFGLAPGSEHRPELATALLIPIDYTNEDPVNGLEIGNERIAGLVAKHFEAKGIKVLRAAPGRFREVASSVKREHLARRKSVTSGSMAEKVDFGDTLPRVLETLEVDADLVISVNVLKRDASYTGTRTIAWDGVKRRESTAGGSISGRAVPVVSLYVEVHRNDGSRSFWGYGGVEPIFKVDVGSLKYEKRPDLLQDDRNISEGICVAFYPYFGMDEYCVR